MTNSLYPFDFILFQRKFFNESASLKAFNSRNSIINHLKFSYRDKPSHVVYLVNVLMIYQDLFDGPFPVRAFLFIKAVEIF